MRRVSSSQVCDTTGANDQCGGSPAGSWPPVRRHECNPILSPADMPVPCSAVFNAGAVRVGEEVLLMLRVEDFRRRSAFHLARSRDGVRFSVEPEPVDYPLRETERTFGTHRFDARITPLDGAYYICHAAWIDPFGCCGAMARTSDFRHFQPLPGLAVPSNRNLVLFPGKIGGRYCRLERPQNIDGSGRIWISYSPDLRYWGDSRPLAMPATAWSTRKAGPGAVPIRTPEGWLTIYHATARTASTENYYLGVMLLDLEDPAQVRACPESFILQPERPYECVGQVPNVVFTCGAVEMDDGTLNIYYGGADTRICLLQSTVAELVRFCLEQG